MLEFLKQYGGNVHSQNGEDGILAEALRRLNIESGHAVEIGGNDGRWLSNTRQLIEQGWSGSFVETQFSLWEKCRDNWAGNNNVKCICSHVDQYNINAFVDDSCDVFSTDTDGDDYSILKGLRAKPKIIIIEIDSSILPDRDEFNSDGGAGYLPMLRLAIDRGYFLLAHTGNLVLIAGEFRELFPEIIGDGISNSELYFNRAWLKDV